MDDEDVEYEYDTSETSTFLVELDLTTLNGVKRQSAARRASRPKRPRKKAGPSEEDAGEPSSHAEEDEAEVGDEGPDLMQNGRERNTETSFQLLDLGTTNPIIAHKGNFYSCAWHDVIGTDMFFALPHQDLKHTPMRSTKDYQLLGTSRIKLVGQRAKVFSKSQARKKQQPQGLSGAVDLSLSEASTPVSDHTAQIKEQGDFLQQVMEIEKSRRTTDLAEATNQPD